jgi:hypothetical protein
VKAFTMADPNTHTTPSAAPVPSCKDTSCTPRHLCVCNWDDCADFQRKIRELADPSHRWNSGLIQIRNSLDSLKILALRASIVHHLRPTKEYQSKDSFFVAAHHWSLSLWQEMTGRPCLATPLTARQAKKYDEHEGYRRHQEDANKLSTIIRRCAPQSNVESGYKPIPSKYEFVKAPVTSKADVLSFVTSLESARSARTEKRQETAQVVTVQKKARVESASHTSNETTTPATPLVHRSSVVKSLLSPDLWPSYETCLEIITDRYNKIAIDEKDLDTRWLLM